MNKSNPTPNDTAVKVTANNYVRAESDLQMKLWIKKLDCFGKFNHNRKPYEEQRVTVHDPLWR